MFISNGNKGEVLTSLKGAKIACLKLEDFHKILEIFPTDKEIFCLIRDDIFLNGNYYHLKIKCQSCGSFTHPIKNCQLLNLNLNPLSVITKYSACNKRKLCTRLKIKKRKKFFKNNKYGNFYINSLINKKNYCLDVDKKDKSNILPIKYYKDVFTHKIKSKEKIIGNNFSNLNYSNIFNKIEEFEHYFPHNNFSNIKNKKTMKKKKKNFYRLAFIFRNIINSAIMSNKEVNKHRMLINGRRYF